ncbi:MAG: transposase [Betaproteobacteria bacterium]|nr:transposase [Betaproteobacteria bacterium]
MELQHPCGFQAVYAPSAAPGLKDGFDEEACLRSLLQFNLGKHGACPHCASAGAQFVRARDRRAFRCSRCGYHLHPLAGTVMRKSSTSLAKWFAALHLIAQSRGRITARELGERLNITYKCAWRMRDRLRAAAVGTWMHEDDGNSDRDLRQFARIVFLAEMRPRG